MRWAKGTLHGGVMDVERMLYRLSKKGLDINNLRAKASEYVDAGHLPQERADSLIRHVEAERKVRREINDPAEPEEPTTGKSGATPARGTATTPNKQKQRTTQQHQQALRPTKTTSNT